MKKIRRFGIVLLAVLLAFGIFTCRDESTREDGEGGLDLDQGDSLDDDGWP